MLICIDIWESKQQKCAGEQKSVLGKQVGHLCYAAPLEPLK